MSDFVDNHSIAKDLPEYRESIHKLKEHDAHFSRLMDEYEVLDKQIVRIEQGLELLPDLELDTLKMKRVQLKDDLIGQIQKA